MKIDVEIYETDFPADELRVAVRVTDREGQIILTSRDSYEQRVDAKAIAARLVSALTGNGS